ncbi:hypothetical protein DM02DRAFT_725055 [Periconia macrospinosa]|uniref:Uncharacterized protein n=1 Tax=Periconia macrospinosa TaxID=97972 RepID=A0A2V1E7P4_9PLEO|nr:hypothetical protein DM02DRAFT_725055 [Periconia macrospinosa]
MNLFRMLLLLATTLPHALSWSPPYILKGQTCGFNLHLYQRCNRDDNTSPRVDTYAKITNLTSSCPNEGPVPFPGIVVGDSYFTTDTDVENSVGWDVHHWERGRISGKDDFEMRWWYEEEVVDDGKEFKNTFFYSLNGVVYSEEGTEEGKGCEGEGWKGGEGGEMSNMEYAMKCVGNEKWKEHHRSRGLHCELPC